MSLQTDSLTHTSSGALRAPWEKEFIDFCFDGKYISEFGMVAVFDGDRHSFAAQPDFDNETTTVNGAAGQLYWGSNIKSKKITFKVATDGMTEQQVNAFKNHFQPGRYGKFIEDKLAHRYGYCRVTQVINFSVLPFRKSINFLGFPLQVNEYKGDATIVFEFDDPYMYSTMNYVEENDKPTETDYINVAKAVYNNGVPLYSSWIGNFYRKYGAELGRAILGVMLLGWSSQLTVKLCHLGKDKCLSFNGSKENPISTLVEDTGHTSINFEDPLIFYNPSNVRTPATITLKFQPHWTPVQASGAWKPVYFDNIADDINWKVAGFTTNCNCIEGTGMMHSQEELVTIDGKQYSTKVIYIPNIDEFGEKFYYTNPSVIYYINRAIQIASNFNNGAAVELEEQFREEITHNEVSKWAISVLAQIRKDSKYCDANDVFTSGTKNISLKPLANVDSYAAGWFCYFNIMMLRFLESNGTMAPFTITFDGRKSNTSISYTGSSMTTTFVKQNFSKQEFCGESMLSPYFLLGGGDTVDEHGYICSCHSLQFRRGGEIDDVSHATLEYDYTYQ